MDTLPLGAFLHSIPADLLVIFSPVCLGWTTLGWTGGSFVHFSPVAGRGKKVALLFLSFFFLSLSLPSIWQLCRFLLIII